MRFLVVCLMALILFSCERKVEVTPNPPMVAFNKPAFATTFTKGKVYFTVSATSTTSLSQVAVLRSVNGSTATTDTTFSISGSTWQWNYVYTAPDTLSQPATIRLFFTVTDVNGVSSSAAFVVSLGAEPLALSAERSGVIYHRNASSRNVLWDLVNNTSRALADSMNADMMNLSVADDEFIAGWRVPLVNPASVYVRKNEFDYDAADVKAVINSLNEPATALGYVMNNVQQGDVILFVLRNGAAGVLKVTQVIATGTTNDQRILFTYKKQG